MQEFNMNRYDQECWLSKKWTNLWGEFLRDYNRQNYSKKSSSGTDEVFQWYKQLEFLKSGEIVLNINVEKIDLDAPHQSVRNWLKNLLKRKNIIIITVLDKSTEILNSKPEERTEADEDVFEKMIAVTLKWINTYQKIIARKKINDLFEIELSDYKQQQSYPTNEHFRGPNNTRNNNMISQNPYSIPQGTYTKTSFPVCPYERTHRHIQN